jgi:hypothetical protein
VNPYKAPGEQSVPIATEDDIAAAVPPVIARVAGGAIALAGGAVALTGVQTLLMMTIRGPLAYAPYLLLFLGAAHLVLGAMVLRAREWAALASIAGAGLLVLASGAWFLVCITHYVFSLYVLASPVTSVVALVFAVVALGPCRHASAARAPARAGHEPRHLNQRARFSKRIVLADLLRPSSGFARRRRRDACVGPCGPPRSLRSRASPASPVGERLRCREVA